MKDFFSKLITVV